MDKISKAARDFYKAIIIFSLLSIIAAFATLTSGCASTYRGGKVVDGSDIEVAIKPTGESQFSLQFFHYLQGFVFYWESNDSVTVTRKTSSKWSVFGTIEGSSASTTEVAVNPCETTKENQQ